MPWYRFSTLAMIIADSAKIVREEIQVGVLEVDL
jgi:hypothetical protein